MRNDLHLSRKLWHAATGMTMVILYGFFVGKWVGVFLLSVLLFLDLAIELGRLNHPRFNESVLRYWGGFMRESERNQMSGTPYYIAAALLAVAIFPKPIALMSILFLAFGDPVASIVGITYGDKWGRFKNGKSFAGSLAAVLVCAMIAYAVASTLGITPLQVWIVALVGGIAGGLAEMIPLDVDDNFSIPMVSGFSLWLVFLILGI